MRASQEGAQPPDQGNRPACSAEQKNKGLPQESSDHTH